MAAVLTDSDTDLQTLASPEGPRRHRLTALSFASPVVFLLLWELASRRGWLDPRYFPPPTDVAAALRDLASSGDLVHHLRPTLTRLVIGLLWGAIPGIVIGLIMGYQAVVRAVVQPLVDLTFPVPKIALYPLLLVIFGLGDRAIYAVVAISTVYLLIINTCDGVRNMPSIYWDVSRDAGASRWMTFRDIALPGALPNIMTGVRLASTVGLLVVVSTEFVGSSTGIGYVIWNSWQLFQIDRMYAGLCVLAIVGLCMALLLRTVERILLPWVAKR